MNLGRDKLNENEMVIARLVWNAVSGRSKE
jgi:hypothetical protein